MTTETTVTPAREVDKFPCPTCSKKVVYDPERAGMDVTCPHCRDAFQMPATELGLLIQIRDNTSDTAYWTQAIFWVLVLPLILSLFGLIGVTVTR